MKKMKACMFRSCQSLRRGYEERLCEQLRAHFLKEQRSRFIRELRLTYGLSERTANYMASKLAVNLCNT